MFSGIVQTFGKIKNIEKKSAGFVFMIDGGKISKNIKIGSSVCVSGVCLTVVKKINNQLKFDVMPETVRKTILEKLEINDNVNLELSLKIGDELGGHFVYGHVDEVGEVVKIVPEGDNWLMTIKISSKFKKYLADEGSVSVDGVSLTIARIKNNLFTVSLIPHTLQATVLGDLQVGDKVNIEYDMMAKYVERILKNNK